MFIYNILINQFMVELGTPLGFSLYHNQILWISAVKFVVTYVETCFNDMFVNNWLINWWKIMSNEPNLMS